MNADAFRHLYEYHFAENRKIWDRYVTQLSQQQFTQPVSYSHGSVREQIVHLTDCDDTWFSELRAIGASEPLSPSDVNNRETIHARWDSIEQKMRVFLTDLRNDVLFTTPIKEPHEDRDLLVWQVLLHVVNHGTDHRAQLLRLLNDMGMKTEYQDYIFYVYGHPVHDSRG